jgi:hypothetical protein
VLRARLTDHQRTLVRPAAASVRLEQRDGFLRDVAARRGTEPETLADRPR